MTNTPVIARRAAARQGLSGFALLFFLAATQMASFADRFLLTLVAQPLKESLALSDAQLGLLQGTAFILLNAVALPVMGRLADRGYQRAILIGSIVVWTTATIGSAFAASFAAIFICRVYLGIGQAGVTPSALSLLGHRLEPHRLGLGTSFLTAGASTGRSVALLGGGLLLAWLAMTKGVFGPLFDGWEPWRMLFILTALPNLALLAFAFLIDRSDTRTGADRASPRAGVIWLYRNRRHYLPIVLASTCAMLLSQTLSAWGPTLYVRTFGLTPADSGILLGIAILIAAPTGHLFSGWLLDRRARTGRPKAALRNLAIALLAVVPATALMCLSSNLPMSVAGFFLTIMILGFTSPPALTGIQWLTPLGLRGQVSAVFIALVTLAALGFGPVTLGLMNDHVFGAANIAQAMLILFAIIGVTGASIATWFSREIP